MDDTKKEILLERIRKAFPTAKIDCCTLDNGTLRFTAEKKLVVAVDATEALAMSPAADSVITDELRLTLRKFGAA